MLDVGEELQVCQDVPHPFVPASSQGRGRKRSRLVIEEKKVSLKSLPEQIQEICFKAIKYRAGTKGQLGGEAVLMKGWVWHKATAEVEEAELLISRKLDAGGSQI